MRNAHCPFPSPITHYSSRITGFDMGMTIAEKILAAKSGRGRVGPGDVVTVDVDTVILFDNNFMPNSWREILKVADPAKLMVTFDHRVPAPTQQAAAAQV